MKPLTASYPFMLVKHFLIAAKFERLQRHSACHVTRLWDRQIQLGNKFVLHARFHYLQKSMHENLESNELVRVKFLTLRDYETEVSGPTLV